MKYSQEILQQYLAACETIDQLEGRKRSSKSIIITSDMHVGAKWALGGELKEINHFWYEARDKLRKERATLFVINGEPIDGDNKKELGHGNWTTNLTEQMQSAVKYLRHYNMDQIGMTRGSNYHTTKDNTSLEEIFALIQDVAPVMSYEPFTRKWRDNHTRNIVIDDMLNIEAHGIVFNIIHHVGFTKWFAYVPTALAREMAQMVFVQDKIFPNGKAPRIIIRSHTHHYVEVKYSHSSGAVTPAWKLVDRHALKSGMSAATIGLIEVVVETNGEYEINAITLGNKNYPKLNVIKI